MNVNVMVYFVGKQMEIRISYHFYFPVSAIGMWPKELFVKLK